MKTQRKERDPRVTVKVTKTPLTKAELVSKIQLTEAAMFLELKKAEREHGKYSNWTSILRSRWNTVHQLMESLGIPADFQLPDNEAATTIICERIAKQQEA